jgi:hypothetical protein
VKSKPKKKKPASGSGNPFLRAGSPAEAMFEAGKERLQKFQKDRKVRAREQVEEAEHALRRTRRPRHGDDPAPEPAQPLSFRAGRAIGAVQRGLRSVDPRHVIRRTRESFQRALGDDDEVIPPSANVPRNAARNMPRNAPRNAPRNGRNASARSAFGSERPGSAVASFDAQSKLEGHVSAAVTVLDHEISRAQRRRAEIRQAEEDIDLDALVQLGVLTIPQSRDLARALRR